MCSLKLFVAAIILVLLYGITGLGQGPTYHLGRAASVEEIRPLDIAIGPEGKELPPGKGNAQDGAKIYAQKCAYCHGPTAAEGPPPRSVGGTPRLVGRGTLMDWSFATSVWDYTNRAMPPRGTTVGLTPGQLRSKGSLSLAKDGALTADEVYALTAWILWRNGIIQESDVMDAQSLPNVRMPNAPKGPIPDHH